MGVQHSGLPKHDPLECGHADVARLELVDGLHEVQQLLVSGSEVLEIRNNRSAFIHFQSKR